MSHSNTIFNQILALISKVQFNRAVRAFQTDRYVKVFFTWRQFMANLYAQISGKDSLRDIETAMRTRAKRWYHLGFENIARSTLAHANKNRDYRVFEDLFYTLLQRCSDLTPKHKFRFKNQLYSLDATTIDLCLSIFPWAKFRKRKGAIKLHCLLDHRGEIPSFIVITEGKHHDAKIAKEVDLPLSPDSILAIDRAYVDYEWLWSLDSQGMFFVTRAKKNMAYRVIGQQEVRGRGVLADEEIELTGARSAGKFPGRMRLVTFVDKEKDKVYKFLTNNFRLAASTIAAIYKERWKIEIFFKWIKQNLKIKTFLGTSKNAVMTQIWIAMIYYLLLAYIKYQTRFKNSLLELERMIREVLFERISLVDLLSLKFLTLHKLKQDSAQLQFF